MSQTFKKFERNINVNEVCVITTLAGRLVKDMVDYYLLVGTGLEG